jgi:type VI secretion system secreted protein VgrG
MRSEFCFSKRHSCEVSQPFKFQSTIKRQAVRAACSVGLAVMVLFGNAQVALAATAPTLGVATSFAILGATPNVNNTGPTIVTGDLGVSPAAAVIGFPPGSVIGTIHAADSVAASAQFDNTAAYGSLAGQACTTTFATAIDLAGMTLTPGVYCFATSAANTGALTLDAGGNASAVWVFKIASTLITGSGSSVTLTNSGQACNVFWQVGSSATLGTTTRFAGSILALTSITLQTGATLSGRALAQTGTVTLASNVVSVCSLAQIPPVIAPAAGAGVAVPTLSEWMWTILGALLLIVGIAAIRRRPAR